MNSSMSIILLLYFPNSITINTILYANNCSFMSSIVPATIILLPYFLPILSQPAELKQVYKECKNLFAQQP